MYVLIHEYLVLLSIAQRRYNCSALLIWECVDATLDHLDIVAANDVHAVPARTGGGYPADGHV
jgi:hypothetical protein